MNFIILITLWSFFLGWHTDYNKIRYNDKEMLKYIVLIIGSIGGMLASYFMGAGIETW